LETEAALVRITPTFSSLSPLDKSINKDATVIWYDKNINLHHSGEVKRIEDLLQQINDYVLIFSDRQTCLDYINEAKSENIFLILSGQSTAGIIDNVHGQKQIDSLYVFCMKRENYEHYLNSDHKYSKLTGIYTEHEPLLKAVQDNIKLLRKQIDAARIFDQDERGMRSLKHAGLHDYNIFRVFKDTLLNTMTDFDREKAREEMIETCRSYYRGNKMEQAEIDDFQRRTNRRMPSTGIRSSLSYIV
jgi:hypothetical protein